MKSPVSKSVATTFWSAVVAGATAAVVSSLPGLAWVLHSGVEWWKPIEQIASLIGIGVHSGGFDLTALLVGGALYIGLSVGYALPFAFATRRCGTRAVLLAGIAYGSTIYLVNFPLFTALGWFDAVRARSESLVELAAHIMFGLTLASGLAVWQRRQ